MLDIRDLWNTWLSLLRFSRGFFFHLIGSGSSACRQLFEIQSSIALNNQIINMWVKTNLCWRLVDLQSFLSFLSTNSWLRRSFSLAASLSFLLASWLYCEARLATIFWSFWTWFKHVSWSDSCYLTQRPVNMTGRCFTSSFSAFKQLCRVLILSCSCLSVSCRPDLSLMESSNWS